MPPHRFKPRRLFTAADGGASSEGADGYLRSAKLIPRIKAGPSDGKADNLLIGRYNTTIHRRIGLKNWALRLVAVMVTAFWFACDSGPREKTQGPPPPKRENAVPMTSAETRPMLPAIDREVPTELRTATFALGWFWGPDARFGSLEGVARTRVGYAGGRQADPTYRRLGDHTETLQIDFAPARIDYQALLTHFWANHNPTRPRPTQYKSVIFYHDETQRRLAEKALAQETARRGVDLHTEIRPFQTFYRAEDYHQKYYLRRENDLLRELEKYYRNSRELVDATAAARINGYLAGFGDRQALVSDGDRLGLSSEGRRRLLEVYAWRH